MNLSFPLESAFVELFFPINDIAIVFDIEIENSSFDNVYNTSFFFSQPCSSMMDHMICKNSLDPGLRSQLQHSFQYVLLCQLLSPLFNFLAPSQTPGPA